jgi:CHAD domain-containing protein
MELLNDLSPAILDIKFGYVLSFLAITDKEMVESFLETLKMSIAKQIVDEDFLPDQIHELRKLLKTYQYVTNSLDHPGHKEKIRKTTDLTDLLGTWHDWHVLAVNLEKACVEEGAEKEETSQIEDLLAKTRAETDRLIVKIKAAVAECEFAMA